MAQTNAAAASPLHRRQQAVHSLLALIALTLLVSVPQQAAAQPLAPNCGQLENAYGPFDFRVNHDKLAIVETFHFTSQVEMLIRGQASTIGGDLDYTLRAFPNHPRALLAMMRFGERLKTERANGARYTFECYFNRAVAFRPDDTTVRMLYATYLDKWQRRDAALQQLAAAKSFAGDNAFTHYNLGLVYLDLGETALALAQAREAQRLGFPRDELKNKLIAAGKWAEPVSASASAPAQQ